MSPVKKPTKFDFISILKKPFIKKFVIYILLILPIVAMYIPVLLSGQKIFEGDFDMQIQMTEAARQSILLYHQFPLWNPWISGGVPLFADPQFGLLTPQTILSLFVGSVFAWKLTIFIYAVVGFFGMKTLLNYLSSNKDQLTIVLLSYIWIFGSFFLLRATGHFTFLILSLLPLLLYCGLNIAKNFMYMFWFFAILAYSINAAMHYSTILMIVFVVSFLVIYKSINLINKIITEEPSKPILITYVKFFAILGLTITSAIVVNFPKIYLSLEYLHDNSEARTTRYENFIGFINGLKSLFIPYDKLSIDSTTLVFGTFETSNYIGLFTGILLVFLCLMLLVAFFFRNIKIFYIPKKQKHLLLTLLIIAIISFVLGLGGQPFDLLRELPVFSSTRVSTRWFFITAFCLIVIIAILSSCVSKYNKYKIYNIKINIINVILITALIEVVLFSYNLQITTWKNNPNLLNVENNNIGIGATIKQDKYWGNSGHPPKNNYFFLTEATINNVGQIIADNALVDTRIEPTKRCDVDEAGCNYIMSDNANVNYWSPNKIYLTRTAPGDIQVNMNPGAHWSVNGQYIFAKELTVNPENNFIIKDDNTKEYSIEYKPLPSFLK